MFQAKIEDLLNRQPYVNIVPFYNRSSIYY